MNEVHVYGTKKHDLQLDIALEVRPNKTDKIKGLFI